MPKGVYPRPRTRLLVHDAAGEVDVRVPLALETACKNFEAEVGGREALIATLIHAPLTKDQELLVGAIVDPRNDEASLARICYTFNIQFADLITLFRSAGFVKAQLQAMRKVWDAVPEVAEDVMGRAVPHYLRCNGCFGRRKVEAPELDEKGAATGKTVEVPCPACDGEGEVLVQPKLETQKVALELGGLIQPKGAPVQVNVTQQQAQGAFQAGGRLGDFYADSDAVVFPQAQEAEETVEAEVVSDSEGREA